MNEIANTENEPLGSSEGICQQVCFARHEKHPTLTVHKILIFDLDTKFQAFPEQPHKSKCLYQLPEPSPPCHGQPHVSASNETTSSYKRFSFPRPAIDPDTLTVLNMRFCPYAQRTILCVNAKEVDYRVRKTILNVP